MTKEKNLFFKSLFALFVMCLTIMLNTSFAFAEDDDSETEINPVSDTDSSTETYSFKGSGLKKYSATGSTTTWSRKISTMISLYVKKGTVPQITKYDGTYSGTTYHVLEADTSDGNTIIKLDYAGSTPQYMNNMYDTTLTANDEYYWAGAINAGFFGNTSGSNSYGYPTGAVRTGGKWQTYSSAMTSNEDWDCTPDYGHGFTSVYFNTSGNSAKFLYNGWYNGVFYKYYKDPSPNTWDYSPVYDYTEGVSGGYTLMVDGDTSVHWGKGDYTSTDYWSYYGTAITLFGQKANGNYVLLTTSAGSLTADQCIALMSKLGCVNGIRFDGGGSSQIAYDNGLYLKSISTPATAEISTADAYDEIRVNVTDGDGKTYDVALTAVSDSFAVSNQSDNTYTLTADTVCGEKTIQVTQKDLNYSIDAKFNKGYATVGESLDDVKADIISATLTNEDKTTSSIDLNNLEITIDGNTESTGTLNITIKYETATKTYQMYVIDDAFNMYDENDTISDLKMKNTNIDFNGELEPTVTVNGETNENIKSVIFSGFDVSKVGVQVGTISYEYYLTTFADNGLMTSCETKTIKNDSATIYVKGVEQIEIVADEEYEVNSDISGIKAQFVQTYADENAKEEDIELDTSAINITKAGEYEIKASYIPSAIVETTNTEISYEKGAGEVLQYDWQLGTNYNIGKDDTPAELNGTKFSDLDSNLTGSYTFEEENGVYYLIGGVDNSRYIRFSESDTTAYVYSFEPYCWSSSSTLKSWYVSSNTDASWNKSVMGGAASTIYKYTGHYDESTSGTLIQNDWCISKTAYTRTETEKKTSTTYYGDSITATKTIKVVEPKQEVTTFNINFYDFDKNLLETVTVNEGDTAVSTLTPSKEGYEFTGWDADLTNISSSMDIYPNFSCSTGYDLENGACVLHQTTTYTVTFVASDATGGSTDSISFTDTENGTIPENGFVREGYSFVNWNTLENGTGTNYGVGDTIKGSDFDTTDIVLYAIWKEDEAPITYTVDFYDFDKQIIDSKTVNEGESTSTELTPEKTGYEFTGWDKDTSNVTSNLSVFPTFNCSNGYDLSDGACILHVDTEYVIHFDGNGAEGEMDDISFKEGETATIPNNSFTNNDYTFIEWNTASNGTGESYKAGTTVNSVSENPMTLYAIWKKIDIDTTEKETQFIEDVEQHYEWSVPATLDLQNGQENELEIAITENVIKANQKLVITADSDIVVLTSENGDTNKAIYSNTKFELASGVVGKKIMKITTEWTPVAGTYKGSSTFTASVVENGSSTN